MGGRGAREMGAGVMPLLFLAVLASLASVAVADITMTTAHASTFDNTEYVALQATVSNGQRSALASAQTVYVLGPSGGDACTPTVEQVIPLPPHLQDANALILIPEEEQLRLYFFPKGKKVAELWTHSYSEGGWAHDADNDWEGERSFFVGVPDWQEMRLVEQGQADDAAYVVLTVSTRLVVFVVRDDPTASGVWSVWDWTDGMAFTSDPTRGIAPTGSSYMFGGVRTSTKTGASAMLLATTESNGVHRGYVHWTTSFYTSPPRLVLSNADQSWPRAFREFWWFQETSTSELGVLHWIGEDGQWFGPNPDDSLRTAKVEVTDGAEWSSGGYFFIDRVGEYSPGSIALAVSGTKTSSRIHLFQFVGDGSHYDIAQVGTLDINTPMITHVTQWPTYQCGNAVLVGARSSSGRVQPTVVALHGDGMGAAELFARHGRPREEEAEEARHTAASMTDTDWCYADEQCVCPDNARSQAPCGPSLCCEAYGSMCWQVGDEAAALTTNCCPESPVPGCTKILTPCQ